jgi:acyl carrier protein
VKSIREALSEILSEHLDVEVEDIEDGNSIRDDLGADSLDEVELLMECEQRFGIEIPDDTAGEWGTVGQAVAWLEGHGATVLPEPETGW